MRLLTREPKFNRGFQDVADQIWNWAWHILKVYTLSYPMVPSQLIAYERIQKYYRLKIFIIRSDFVTRWTIHSLLSWLQTIISIKSLYILSVSAACTIRITFWWIAQMHTECVRLEPTVVHHLGRREQNLENPTLISGCRYFKVVYASFRLHRCKCRCLWTFLLMLTKSFLPGINLVCSSFSKKSYTMSVTVIDSVLSLTSVLVCHCGF